MSDETVSAAGGRLPGEVDIAIIGGGPAGSTLGALAAERGWRVAVFEKENHPRFHIGESLLPMNLSIYERLGVLDRVEALGVFKPGVDFMDATHDSPRRVIRFENALKPRWPHAYQVRRSEFDKMLFENAAEKGALTFTGVRVCDAEFPDDADPVLTIQVGGGEHRVAARFVVDASGRDNFLGKKFKLQRRNLQHGTAALFAHFKNVLRNEGEEAGNISIYWFDEGWIWMIPLTRDVMSVGAVCNPDYLRRRDRDPAAFLMKTLERNPHAVGRMKNAELHGHVTATGNYSYRCTRMDGPRWLMIGDAYAFVDPVFSSGVYLGTHSATAALPALEAELSGQRARARRLRRRYRRRIKRGIREFSWVIYRFPSPVMRQLFLWPKPVLKLEEAVISLLAGDVFDNFGVRWRMRVFRLVYLLVGLPHMPAAWAHRRQRLRNARVEFDRAT